MSVDGATGQQRRGAAVRARVIERATGAVAGEIEAENTYDLWLALLDWGERQGVPRFQVPARYRTEHRDDRPSTALAPAGQDKPDSAAGQQPDHAGPAVSEATASSAPPPSAPAPAAQLALWPALTGLSATANAGASTKRTAPTTRPRRPTCQRRPAAEQLRLF